MSGTLSYYRRLARAVLFAERVHAEQVRKYAVHEPYIVHPLRVMLAVPEWARVVAVLHDVVEDDPSVTIRDLIREAGCHPVELRALSLLTRGAEEYPQYILRIINANGPEAILARTVKLADLEDNLNGAPVNLEARYTRAYAALTLSIATQTLLLDRGRSIFPRKLQIALVESDRAWAMRGIESRFGQSRPRPDVVEEVWARVQKEYRDVL